MVVVLVLWCGGSADGSGVGAVVTVLMVVVLVLWCGGGAGG